jgi:molybdenum-dependent DNA-binding transcriptional regulator ModE
VTADRTLGEPRANVRRMLNYLDPGTGSMIVAAFAGGAAGFGVLLKMYGHRALGIFSKKHRAQAEEARAQLAGERDADTDTDTDVDANASA